MINSSLKTFAAAAVFALTLPFSAQAAPVPSPNLAGLELLVPSLSQKAYHPASRCGHWRRTCAYRWGFGTWRYRRCMRWHGC